MSVQGAHDGQAEHTCGEHEGATALVGNNREPGGKDCLHTEKGCSGRSGGEGSVAKTPTGQSTSKDKIWVMGPVCHRVGGQLTRPRFRTVNPQCRFLLKGANTRLCSVVTSGVWYWEGREGWALGGVAAAGSGCLSQDRGATVRAAQKEVARVQRGTQGHGGQGGPTDGR